MSKPRPLRLLHSSDWHLGRPLCGRRRYDDYARFLDWLAATLDREQVDVLLLAGDIFDCLNPSTRAQALYYNFLGRVAVQSACRHVVVIAGNHDSPALLKAPGEILKLLDIHVVGTVSEDGREELITLKDPDGRPELLAAAVPYPRERDMRSSVAGESAGDKEERLVAAIGEHYALLGRLAEAALAGLDPRPPAVALGHLFAAGGRTLEEDGARNLYVGALGRVPLDVFPPLFDYVALGHLHQPQLLGGRETRRYSGAPLALGFGEAGREKTVVLVDFYPDGPQVRTLPVPLFRRLERIRGDWAFIAAELSRLADLEEDIWVDVEYDGTDLQGELGGRLAEAVEGRRVTVLRVRDGRARPLALEALESGESLDSLDEEEVFRRCLAARQVPEEDRAELTAAYLEILRDLRENADREGGRS
ncbi:MAG: exonuclease SbcCD subunit D C-terminal domain-containing protein [Candidatus Adiutrix sp.]|jgi:exonuclease SbcD|nr:exonuclease SbcCD subunit D C-terminal domain-containing protein [Candidatus Adiutrix sp.]